MPGNDRRPTGTDREASRTEQRASGYVNPYLTRDDRHSVVDARSGLVVVPHDLERDHLRELCAAQDGCGWAGAEVIRAAAAGPTVCCWSAASPREVRQ